jgi:hypothetical protein
MNELSKAVQHLFTIVRHQEFDARLNKNATIRAALAEPFETNAKLQWATHRALSGAIRCRM